ncbi:hypothetical protein H0B56_05970 [Haloechinothrix sp. YIM 98757]|uniref:Uncharacterized protein n=1 Tax=Haloechinothrix aidingensis TaxID=2752311 RepID=A0A838A7I2_9PSEU|nr:hypothetical protein [Haloechinothrix aidingensis]MBA0125085.1 hypothetical protein [Haloechinothrix aidingensis]
MSDGGTFLDACLYGLARVDDVDEWVDHWHNTGGAPYGEPIGLAEYLGLEPDEYAQWVQHDETLSDIVVARALQHRERTTRYIGDPTSEPVYFSDNPLVSR